MRRKQAVAAMIAAASAVIGSSAARATNYSFNSFTTPNYNGAAATNSSSPTPLGYSADGSTFMLTNGIGSEATSGFLSNPVDATSFQVQFTYQASSGADGAALVFQNVGSTFLGASGGGLGYQGSSASAALLLNIYSGYTKGTRFATGGFVPSSFNGTGSIGSTDPIRVTVNYSNNNVSASFVDLATKNTAVMNYGTYNIPAAVGAGTALIGFTGGTGGITATQNVSNFSYTATAAYNYQPLSLTAPSFNQDVIVDAAAPFGNVSSYVTATMDSGTAKTGATFFETGYNGSIAGLPHAGNFNSQADPNHVFLMQPSAGNNALQLNYTTTAGTISLVTPTTAAALSFLYADGNGSQPFSISILHTNGYVETINNIAASDWYNGGPTAYVAGTRVNNLTNGTVDGTGNNPRLYQDDVLLSDTVDPITSITINYTGTNSGTQMTFFGVSAAAPVPEPMTLGLIGLAAAGLTGRRRSR